MHWVVIDWYYSTVRKCFPVEEIEVKWNDFDQRYFVADYIAGRHHQSSEKEEISIVLQTENPKITPNCLVVKFECSPVEWPVKTESVSEQEE